MRAALWLSYGLLIALLVSPAGAADEDKKIDLLAGEGLAGWDFYLVDSDVKKDDVWSLEDGVLKCKGEPLGYLYTKKKFTNFKLSLDWRWAPGGKPGNSGVLLRIAGEPVSFLPKCVEAQLASGSAGDIWAFYGASVKGDADRSREVKAHKQLGDFGGVGKIKAAEKEPGQWNTYEITMVGGNLTLVVNGEKVNEATDCDVLAGAIGLQSEGGEIHFRNIHVTPLPSE
jgi:hypothetical protein